MVPDQQREEFHNITYVHQNNDEATTLFKQILNYFISYEYREQVVARLFDRIFGPDFLSANQFYMDRKMLRQMADQGMVIGSHGKNHLVFSKLSDQDQEAEIVDSVNILSDATARPIETFCYPYGGRHTFTATTEALLENNGMAISFDVDNRDVTDQDFKEQPQALPRFDCNFFPFGKAHLGPSLG